MRKKLKYGVQRYADGGKVELYENPLPAPKKGGKPKRITTTNPPGGPQTPGAKKKKKKDGG